MGNSYFKFKQFVVHQDKVAMKVGTDGVLLGAWVNVEQSQRVLDVGVGTGLISLMIAQRNANAEILAIDIDEYAYEQATINFEASPWSDRLSAAHQKIQDVNPVETGLFDLIVCNPPFYIDGFKSDDQRRNLARHSDVLTYQDLLWLSSPLLTQVGKIGLIYPCEYAADIISFAQKNELYLLRQTSVHPTETKPAKRVLLEFGKNYVDKPLVTDFVLEINGRHNYSPEYKALTKDFYLAF